MRFRAWHASVVGFAIACAVVAGLAWLSLDRMNRLQEETALVRHSLAIREQTESVLSLMKDAETGQRGYIITGDPGYLAPFAQAVVDMPAQLASLRRLTEDDPGHQARVQGLEAAITQKMAELDATIRARTDQGFDVAARIIATDRGKQLMDDIRQLATQIVREEDRLYAAAPRGRRARRARSSA
jgi:CHASE3 domain sensor protein